MFRQAMHMPTKGATMAEQTSKADRVKLNRELAQMLKGGVIMDVTTPEQARIAEEAGACASSLSSASRPTSVPQAASRV
mgnify:CR=1 FL=1